MNSLRFMGHPLLAGQTVAAPACNEFVAQRPRAPTAMTQEAAAGLCAPVAASLRRTAPAQVAGARAGATRSCRYTHLVAGAVGLLSIRKSCIWRCAPSRRRSCSTLRIRERTSAGMSKLRGSVKIERPLLRPCLLIQRVHRPRCTKHGRQRHAKGAGQHPTCCPSRNPFEIELRAWR